MNLPRLRVPASAVVGLLLLAACTTASPQAEAALPPALVPGGADDGARSGQEAEARDVSDGAPAEAADDASGPARFVACLHVRGVEARIDDLGFVVVRTDVPMDAALYLRRAHLDDAGDAGTLALASPGAASVPPASPADLAELDRLTPLTHLFTSHESADGGDWLWVAPVSSEAFRDDAGRTAWLECQAETPGFTQLTWDNPRFLDGHDPALAAQQAEAALAFAARARAEGFPWVADPAPEAPTTILLPTTLTETELRALLAAALDPADGWIGFDAAPDDGPAFAWRDVIGEFYGAGLG